MLKVHRSAIFILTLGFGIYAGCDFDATEDASNLDRPLIQEQVHETQWIIRFRDAQSLQHHLGQAEQQHDLGTGMLNSAAGTEATARMRRGIESAQMRQGATRVSELSARQGITLTHLRVLANGADLVDLGSDGWAVADQLRDDPEVDYIEPDARMVPTFVPNDPLWSAQWHYHEATAGLNLPAAWDVATGSGAVVAVLDTGSTNHSDLNANTLSGYDFISFTSVSRDGDGRDSNPQDEGDHVLANECYPGSWASDSSWHGTHVAGTIAAVTDNNKGVAGVAFDAKIYHARVLGRCGGYTSDIADAIVWASGGAVSGVPANANPADAINMSLGGSGSCSSTYQNAINTAVANGTAVVVAAGNSNIDVSNSRPANCDNVIAVAASDRQGNRAYYSNYGAGIDVTAPGGETATAVNGVASTLNSGTTTVGSETYVYYQGTSMATPHVAGVVALMRSVDSSLSPADIESRLKSTARALAGSCSGGCGAGLVDAAAAVNFDDSINGSWTMSGGRSYTTAANPRFRLSLSQSSSVQIDLSSSVDTYLYLLNSSGGLMYSNDDGGPGLNSRLNVSLGAGDYILVAGTYSSNRVGNFEISSTHGDLAALAQGTWSYSGGRDMSSSGNPRFVLDLNEQSTVELNLMSSVDTYLYLLNQNGDLLYYNDDGGAGLNSRLTLALAAGEYVIVAATYSTGRSGSFDITSSHGVVRSAPTSFSMVSGDGAQYCPSGYFLSSRADVTTNRSLAEAQLPTWHIARLTEGWALRGPGYGYDFEFETVVLGHTLCGARN